MDSPMLVSIVMPTYNRETLLPVAIESVLAQTYHNFELIIVDDGSKDATQELVASYMEKDSRIRYLYQENQGQSTARNYGIECSQGEYIAFLDSDNIWEPNRLKEGTDVLAQNSKVGLCYANVIFIDAKGDELHRQNMTRHSGFVFPKLIVDNFVSMNTVLVRRAILPSPRPFNEKNRLDEDYELWLDMSVNNEYCYIAKYLARYRIEGERISNNFMMRLDANEATVLKTIQKYNLDVSDSRLRKGLAGHYLRRAAIIGRHGSFVEALKNVLTAIKYDQFSLRPFVTLCRMLLVKTGIKN